MPARGTIAVKSLTIILVLFITFDVCENRTESATRNGGVVRCIKAIGMTS